METEKYCKNQLYAAGKFTCELKCTSVPTQHTECTQIKCSNILRLKESRFFLYMCIISQTSNDNLSVYQSKCLSTGNYAVIDSCGIFDFSCNLQTSWCICNIKTEQISLKASSEVAELMVSIKRGNRWKESNKDKVHTTELSVISVGSNLCPEAERLWHQPAGGVSAIMSSWRLVPILMFTTLQLLMGNILSQWWV